MSFAPAVQERIMSAARSKNLLPLLRHDNDTYSMVEVEGTELATGLLSRTNPGLVPVCVYHSSSPNAYSFRHEDSSFVVLASELLRRLEQSVTGFLSSPHGRAFITTQLSIPYDAPSAWEPQMTSGLRPSTRRHEIGGDVAVSLFYEVFDGAWCFCILHEAAHLMHGDAGGGNPSDALAFTGLDDALDMMAHGGLGPARWQRMREFRADRQGGCWLTQLLLRKYVGTPPRPDPFWAAHLVLATLGAMAALLLIAHHEPDSPGSDDVPGHPSFDIRLVGLGEGIEEVLTAPDGPLQVHVGYQLFHLITEGRKALEAVVLGDVSKYMISG